MAEVVLQQMSIIDDQGGSSRGSMLSKGRVSWLDVQKKLLFSREGSSAFPLIE